ncbi:hypothetical protein PG993_008449 [Apiospora rasikravindrae]|uniref:Uncharacterized protein n=1 Tax=Apiospora rasikravindrae TaxID=990691 RepID=A0ABR1T2Q9_9PEZI
MGTPVVLFADRAALIPGVDCVLDGAGTEAIATIAVAKVGDHSDCGEDAVALLVTGNGDLAHVVDRILGFGGASAHGSKLLAQELCPIVGLLLLPRNCVPNWVYFSMSSFGSRGHFDRHHHHVLPYKTKLNCPSSQQKFQCESKFRHPHMSTLACVSDLPATNWTLSPVTIETSGSKYVTTWVSTAGAINAYGVQIRHGAADAIPLPSTSLTATLTSATTDSTPTSLPASISSSSSGLSAGAAAGIGAGCTLAALAIVSAAAFLVLQGRRRKNHKKTEGEHDFEGDGPQPVVEASGFPIAYVQGHRNNERQQYEMDAIRRPSELAVGG